MIDINDIKQAARVTTNQNGESVVQIPLTLWQELLERVEAKPSQVDQIWTLLQKWDNEPEDAMSDTWWDEFTDFLNQNRINFSERNLGRDVP